MSYLTRALVVSGTRVRADFSPEWAVRAMFGGALAAATVRAARAVIRPDLQLSDGLFAFLAPTPPGEAHLAVTPLRVGRRGASATVTITCDGLTTVHAMLTLTATPAPAVAADPAPAGPGGRGIHVGFGGATRWMPHGPTPQGGFEADLRGAGAACALPGDEWLCIAADLLGPALTGAVAGPFAVATSSLAVAVLGSVSPGDWLRQSVSATAREGTASGSATLRGGRGVVVARAHQQAHLLPATAAELPRSVTAFADSSADSQLIGMN